MIIDLEYKLRNVIRLFKSQISKRYLRITLDRVVHDINDLKNYFTSRDFKKLSILDVGGGLGLFSIGLKILNVHKSVIVDDFSELFNSNKEVKNIFKRFNVDCLKINLLSNDTIKLKKKYDVVTCFHTIEHFHHSPKKLLFRISKILKNKGLFILCAPNSNNIKKRIECFFGFYTWSNLNDYFYSNTFRGHVREPNVSDLIFFTKYMKLKIVNIYGRNWQGLSSENRFIRIITIIFDKFLRLFPSLCSDIYIVAKKI